MAKPFIATLMLNFFWQKAQVTCHFEKKRGQLI